MAWTSRALQNTDILREILERVDVQKLQSCIIVNKIFSDYALDLKWRYLRDLTGLLAVIPSFQNYVCGILVCCSYHAFISRP